MSMLNIGRKVATKTENKMPKAPGIPAPTPEPQPLRNFDPAALNFAQRIIDTEAELERLRVSVDEWRAKALAAEEDVRRLDARIQQDRKTYEEHITKITDKHDREVAQLSATRDRDVDRLTDERDHYKLLHARTIERLHVAGKIVLDALQPFENEKHFAPPVNVDAMEREISLAAPTPIEKPKDQDHEAPQAD
jgi:hypothetical protein